MTIGSTSILTPRAVSTSEAPDSEETARLPCLATGTPAPAATMAAQVETLKVLWPSPPVPTMSTASGGASTGSMRSRISREAPVISAMVSPRTRSAIRKARHLHRAGDARHHGLEGVDHFVLGQRGAARHLLHEKLQLDGGHVGPIRRRRGRRARCGGAGSCRRAAGSWRAARGPAARRCSRGGIARHAPDASCAAGP